MPNCIIASSRLQEKSNRETTTSSKGHEIVTVAWKTEIISWIARTIDDCMKHWQLSIGYPSSWKTLKPRKIIHPSSFNHQEYLAKFLRRAHSALLTTISVNSLEQFQDKLDTSKVLASSVTLLVHKHVVPLPDFFLKDFIGVINHRCQSVIYFNESLSCRTIFHSSSKGHDLVTCRFHRLSRTYLMM